MVKTLSHTLFGLQRDTRIHQAGLLIVSKKRSRHCRAAYHRAWIYFWKLQDQHCRTGRSGSQLEIGMSSIIVSNCRACNCGQSFGYNGCRLFCFQSMLPQYQVLFAELAVPSCSHHSKLLAEVDEYEVSKKNQCGNEAESNVKPRQPDPINPGSKCKNEYGGDKIANKGHTNNRICNNLLSCLAEGHFKKARETNVSVCISQVSQRGTAGRDNTKSTDSKPKCR